VQNDRVMVGCISGGCLAAMLSTGLFQQPQSSIPSKAFLTTLVIQPMLDQ